MILSFFILQHYHNKSSTFSKVYYHKSFLNLKVSGTSVVSTKQVGESATITTHRKLEMMAVQCLSSSTMFVPSFWLTRLESFNGDTHSTVKSKTN